jgi:hypothetical protein
METRMTRKQFQVTATLALLVAVLMVASRFFQPLALLTLPATWPGLFILGADETQERYGYWGEMIWFWLGSLPCIIAYGWLLCRWWQRRRAPRDGA